MASLCQLKPRGRNVVYQLPGKETTFYFFIFYSLNFNACAVLYMDSGFCFLLPKCTHFFFIKKFSEKYRRRFMTWNPIEKRELGQSFACCV